MRRAGMAIALGCSALAACAPGDDAAPDAAALPVFEGVSVGAPTGSSGIASEGLVAAYDMTSTTEDGRLRDFGPNGLHGAMTSASPVDGAISGARTFSAVETAVDLPEAAHFDLDGPLTIATWVRVDRGDVHQHIVACDDKWALWITPANQFRLGDTRGGGWSTVENAVPLGDWVPVVVVLSGTRGDPLDAEHVSLWVSGEIADAEAHLRSDVAREVGTWNPGDLYPSDACHIGFESHQGMESHKTLPFFGAVDEVLIFGRAWSDEEVRAFSRTAPTGAPTSGAE